MTVGRHDPGSCLICDAPHCECGGGPLETVQLPARDAAAERKPGVFVAVASTSIFAPIGDGTDSRPFSTATYRRKPKR